MKNYFIKILFFLYFIISFALVFAQIVKTNSNTQNIFSCYLFLFVSLFILTVVILYLFYQINKANKLLTKERQIKKKYQNELLEVRNNIEIKIQQRTQELSNTINELKKESKEHSKQDEILKHYEFIANNSKDFMTLINKNYRYEVVNNAYAKALGKDKFEIIGKKVEDIWQKKHYNETIKQYLELGFSGKEVHYRQWFPFSEGINKYFDVAYYPYKNTKGEITHLVVVTRDITKQKEMEKQLFRNERLAALGEMAAGVAHEIKNPIAIMKSSAQYYKTNYNSLSEEKIKKIMDIFIETSERMNNTLNELLEFTKPNEIQYQLCNFVDVIKKMIQFTNEKCQSANIKIQFQYSHNEIIMKMDEEDMNKAILNLLQNSFDALTNGGIIDIELIDEDDRICFSIKDNGKGIEESDLTKIFNPFYTTKRVSSGLGLSMVQQTVNDHYGNINVISNKNSGTTITINFYKNLENL